jgi:xylan 1,4-beta-xylosidase
MLDAALAAALLAGGLGAMAAEPEVVQVVEDFEGPGAEGLWQPVADAPVGRGAGLTSNVFKNWGGLAFPLQGVPKGADGLSFWVRTDDGETAAITLALFESLPVEGRLRQVEAWGNRFWATPAWQKYTFPLKGMETVWAWKPDRRLDRERVTTVQFPRSFWEGNGMRSARVVFDQVQFVRGATDATVERKEAGYRLTVDAAKPQGPLRRFWRALSPGPSGEQNTHLQGAAGEALRLIAREKTFDVLRVAWHVRPHKSAYVPYEYGAPVYTQTEDATPVFEFKDQDTFLDAVVRELRLRPMVLLGCLPNALGSRIEHGKAMNGPPNDHAKWKGLVETFARHYAERYGRDEVAQWYWEVWNEPDLWWFNWYLYGEDGKKQEAKPEAFAKLYDYAAAGLVQALPGARVGGPAIAGYPRYYCRELLLHCVGGTNHCTGGKGAPLQFLSHHCYGGALEQLRKLYGEADILAKHAQGRDIEIQVTEYAPSIFGQPLGTRYQAASLCQSLDAYLYAAERGAPIRWLHWFGLVREFDTDAAAYFAPKHKDARYQVTTLFLCPKPAQGPGTLLAKPVYNAYRMLTHVEGQRLAVAGSQFGDPVHAIAAASSDGKRLAILVYHHEPRDTRSAGPSQPVALTVTGLPFDGAMRVSHYAIDSGHSDVFAAWEKLGTPPRDAITPEQIQQIKAHDGLELVSPPARVAPVTKGGSWSAELRLEPHAIALLVLAAE